MKLKIIQNLHSAHVILSTTVYIKFQLSSFVFIKMNCIFLQLISLVSITYTRRFTLANFYTICSFITRRRSNDLIFQICFIFISFEQRTFNCGLSCFPTVVQSFSSYFAKGLCEFPRSLEFSNGERSTLAILRTTRSSPRFFESSTFVSVPGPFSFRLLVRIFFPFLSSRRPD